MRWLLSPICFFISTILFAQIQPPPIGLWNEHLPYNSTIDLAEGNGKVYAATPYSIFTVERSSNAIERWSRITGLSETGIAAICFDAANTKLVIAYANSNIDIISTDKLVNVPDIKRDNISGNKNIYGIYPLGKNYFLSTGLGVVVLDGDRYEIKDTWFIGNGGNQVRVNGFTSNGSFYYAATEEGLKRANNSSPNLADPASWQLVSGTNGLAPGPCQQVIAIQGKVIVQKNDSLFVSDGTNWNFLYQENGWQIINTNVSENKLLLSQRSTAGIGKVTILNNSGVIERTISQVAPVSFPRKAILVQGEPWVADQFGSLSHFTATAYEQYKLNSPEATASGQLLVRNHIFYATAGEVNDAWNYQYNGNGIYILKEGQWENINRFRFTQLDTLLDFITIDIDPVDQSVWEGSYGGGLLHIKKDGGFEIIKQNVLGPAVGDPTSYRVSGIAFDPEGNLWVSNYGATQPLLVKKTGGNWFRFTLPFSIGENALTQITVDDNNYIWIVAAKGGGLICYDHGNAIDNTGDDRWRRYGNGAGNGNLPSDEVLCTAKDKNGFIWVGTTNGIGVIQCSQDVFIASGCNAIWPVVKQGSFAGYLFAGEEVRSIAVDGADRKWVATKNGVWLISATGEEVLYQFTEINSPLLSNDVKQVAIDGTTGEVYFATAKGICSFRSTATEGNKANQSLQVFPNPVPPGFTGTIGIRGLVDNAIVKITELDGRLVYQGRALGGQFVWDGRDYRGRKITTGVYLVLVSNDERTEKTAARIVFVSK